MLPADEPILCLSPIGDRKTMVESSSHGVRPAILATAAVVVVVDSSSGGNDAGQLAAEDA